MRNNPHIGRVEARLRVTPRDNTLHLFINGLQACDATLTIHGTEPPNAPDAKTCHSCQLLATSSPPVEPTA